MPIKTFRGLISNEAQDTIVLHTNDGSTGYKIVKFELFSPDPAVTDQESVVKIHTTPQTGTPTNTIDFSDQTLLAVAYLENNNQHYYTGVHYVVFDNMIFNQDIYLTHKESQGTAPAHPVNYYLELEQVKLDLSESTVATLKDIRNVTDLT